ncbi:hypothetical protein Y032_0007g3401 [Ancylostoma ceylanicum]|nr:hypothetical protein Y032_0007g3401 [Ancylostoma ceylanicum]
MHNYRRSILAQGQVTKRNNNYMPRASNMIELKYDCTLEVAARDRAQSCATNEIQGGLENKYMVSVSSVNDRVEAMAKGVKEWWKQVRKDAPIGMAVTFRDHHQYLPIRSFTRVRYIPTLLLYYPGSIAVSPATLVPTNIDRRRRVAGAVTGAVASESIRTEINAARNHQKRYIPRRSFVGNAEK